MTTYTVNKDRVEDFYKTVKIDVHVNGKVYNCVPKRYNAIQMKNNIDRVCERENQNVFKNEYIRNLYSYMHDNAYERQIDNVQGSVFEVFNQSMRFIWRKESDQLLLQQQYQRRGNGLLYNRDSFIAEISTLINEMRARKNEIKQREWSNLVNRIGGNNIDLNAPKELPYVTIGDWTYAKEGVDIVGIPLDKSVTKLIGINTVTGEEEIYSGKPRSIELQQAIAEASKVGLFDFVFDENAFNEREELFLKAPTRLIRN